MRITKLPLPLDNRFTRQSIGHNMFGDNYSVNAKRKTMTLSNNLKKRYKRFKFFLKNQSIENTIKLIKYVIPK